MIKKSIFDFSLMFKDNLNGKGAGLSPLTTERFAAIKQDPRLKYYREEYLRTGNKELLKIFPYWNPHYQYKKNENGELEKELIEDIIVVRMKSSVEECLETFYHYAGHLFFCGNVVIHVEKDFIDSLSTNIILYGSYKGAAENIKKVLSFYKRDFEILSKDENLYIFPEKQVNIIKLNFSL